TTAGNASASIATVITTCVLSPTAIGHGNVAVTIWPTAPTDQPVPAPVTYVRPAGSVSSTVTALVTGSVPSLRTVSVYVPVPPTANPPAPRLPSERSGPPVTVVVAVDASFAPF